MTPEVSQALRYLADELATALHPLAASASEAVLLDAPNYPNVGDSAITLGEMALLSQMGIPVSAVLTPATARLSSLAGESDDRAVFIINGGGNLSGLYPHHHQHRLQILRALRGRRVIQAPQSFHVADPSAVADLRNASQGHGLVHFVLRDRVSFDAAKQLGRPTTLSPDAVHALGPLPAPDPLKPIVVLARTDPELDASRGTAPQDAVDWVSDRSRSALRRRLHAPLSKIKPFGSSPASTARTELYLRQRLHVGIDLLAQGEVIVTDRLHALLLGLQLGRPVVVMRSRTPKIEDYYSTWLAALSLPIYWADDFAAALRMADELSRRPGWQPRSNTSL